jgi:glycosyltransferase involved in cell wall biosynthesis
MYMFAQIARADHIVTPSEFCRREVIRFLRVPAERVTVTHLAAHKQFQKPPSSPPQRAETLAGLGIRPPYLLYVGGYERHKNVLGLLVAFAAVKLERTDLQLVLVGSKGLPNKIPALAASLGLDFQKDVRFLLDLTDQLTDVYDGAELFVSLSWRETFCLPALEAMTRGLPVVASAWGGTPEVVGDAGTLVDPQNKEAAVKAILQNLSSNVLAKTRECAKIRTQQFNWETTASKTRSMYCRLMSQNQKKAISPSGFEFLS